MKKLSVALICGLLAGCASEPTFEPGVIITPGVNAGSAITASYDGTAYTLFEDCSVSVEVDGTMTGSYADIADMPASDPVTVPLQDEARKLMPWCEL